MAGELDTNAGAAPAEQATNDQASSLERREALRRFGVYAACTAPVLTVLMASRQSEAGGFSRNGTAVATAAIGGGSGVASAAAAAAAVVVEAAAAAVSPADIQLSCGRGSGRGGAPAALRSSPATALGRCPTSRWCVLQIVSSPLDEMALVAAPATGAVAVVDATARAILEGLRQWPRRACAGRRMCRGQRSDGRRRAR